MPIRCLPNGVVISFNSGVGVERRYPWPPRSTTMARVMPGEVETMRCMSMKLSMGWPLMVTTRSLAFRPALRGDAAVDHAFDAGDQHLAPVSQVDGGEDDDGEDEVGERPGRHDGARFQTGW